MQDNLALGATILDQVVHAVETAQQGRFTATTGANKGGDLFFPDFEVNVLQRLDFTVIKVKVAHGHRHGRLRLFGAALDVQVQLFLGNFAGFVQVSNPRYLSRRRLRATMATAFNSKVTSTSNRAVA